jgi:hypothetical protein
MLSFQCDSQHAVVNDVSTRAPVPDRSCTVGSCGSYDDGNMTARRTRAAPNTLLGNGASRGLREPMEPVLVHLVQDNSTVLSTRTLIAVAKQVRAVLGRFGAGGDESFAQCCRTCVISLGEGGHASLQLCTIVQLQTV